MIDHKLEFKLAIWVHLYILARINTLLINNIH